MREVFCLDTGVKYLYPDSKTPYQCMESILYTLNLKQKDSDAKIGKTKSGLHLYIDHCGKTYAIRNN